MMTNTMAVPAGGGQGDPNHKTSSSRHNDDDDHHNGDSTGTTTTKNTTATTVVATTGAMTNLVVSTASSTSSSSENIGSSPNDSTHTKNKEAAATSPSPSPSVKSVSEGIVEPVTAAMTAASPPPSTATATTDASPPPSTEDPHDECVLCCYHLPIRENESQYQSCCGEVICNGCIIAQKRTLIIGTNVVKPIANSKEEDLEFITILTSEQVMVCPFCRKPEPTNQKEILERLWTKIDERDDPIAMNMLGTSYKTGDHGLSTNLKKAEELYQRAYDLGHPFAAVNLYNLFLEKHVPDQARAMKCLKEGVKRGNPYCMINMGWHAAESGNHEETKRLYIMAARSGHDAAMNNLMARYRGKLLSKDDLATTLRAFKVVNDKRKSEPREYAIRQKAFDKGFEERFRIDSKYTVHKYFNSRRHTSQNINATDFLSLLQALAKVKKSHGGT